MKGSHRKCEEAPKKYDEKRRASSSFGMLNGANAAYGKVIWKAPPLKRFKGGTVILCGDKGMDAPHLVRLCGALCGGALSGTTSSLRSSCRLRRGEPTTKDTLCGVCALSGATSPLGGSCRRKRRGELRQFVPSGTQNENGRLLPPVSFWWTCAESNCGLTRFLRGSYTLSRRSVSRKESSPTTFPYACFRESLCGRGSQPPQRVPH